MSASGPLSERALILAPHGRDGEVAASILKAGGYAAEVHPDIAALCAQIGAGAGLALIADEALLTSDLRPLTGLLGEQPPWSDFPFLVLTRRGGGPERNPAAARLAELLGNVLFVERPFHPTTLLSSVRTAIRGRRRQYEARARLVELSEGEERLRTALTAGHLGSWVLDVPKRTLLASKTCKSHYGRGPDEAFSYDDLMASLHPEDRARMIAQVRASILAGAHYAIEYRNVWPDGSIHWVDVRGRALRGADGTVTQLAGVSSDITGRKTAELERERLLGELDRERAALALLTRTLEERVTERTDQLRDSDARMRAVFESSYQFQTLLTPSGTILDANPISLAAIGARLSDVAGKRFWETAWFTASPDVAETVRAAIDRVRAGEMVRQELRLELPAAASESGARWFDFTLRPLQDADGAVIAIVSEAAELTQRRRAEEALRQAQKMEAVGQLTGGVAHDFNNLLAAVMGNLDLLRKHAAEDARSQRLIDGALQGARRGAVLTQRMLAFARQQDLKTRAADLKGLVLGMEDLLDRTLGPQIALHFELADGLAPAQVDPNQIELAVLNLSINARDAMPEGGKITICLDAAPKPKAEGGALFLRLRIADTGSGMDAETLKKAVEPFFSTKPVGKGTGLGLSMVHGLAVQLGGAFELASTVGEGTTATLWLPTAEAAFADPPAPVAAAPTPAAAPSRPARILVVDDDMLIAMSAVDMLEDLGHTVLEANSGAAALDILARDGDIDLMMTDQAMPGMTGIELARRAREQHPGMPILLATGYADLPSSETLNLPRLAKPYMQEQLRVEIEKLLAR